MRILGTKRWAKPKQNFICVPPMYSIAFVIQSTSLFSVCPSSPGKLY
jgi:hypothetical protein